MATEQAAAKLVELAESIGRQSTLKVNERVSLGEFRPVSDYAEICLLARTMDRCGLVLEVEKAPAAGTLVLYAARRTRRATTVTV